MGQGRTLYTPEDITASGEALERQKGSAVTAWEVFKALGSRGKFERVEQIWEAHVASRGATATPVAEELPEQLLASLDGAIATAAASIRALFAGESARQTASHVRQIQRLESQHADEVAELQKAIAALKAENANWRDEVRRLGDREEELAQEVERERDLRRKAEEAATRASTLPWPLPIRGDRVPLVSPVRVAPAVPPMRPEPIAGPEPVAGSIRRGRSRSEMRRPVASEDAVEGPGPKAPPPPAVDPGQIEMPI